MGFILQLGSNGASRVLYIYLVAYLAGLEPDFATAHATLLGYVSSLVILFSLNIYQHTIARNGNNLQAALASCAFQYRALLLSGLGLWAAALLMWLLEWQVSLGVLVVLASLSLAQVEVTFSMVTAHGKEWRPLFYYGSQSVFFVSYLIMVSQQLSVAPTVLVSVTPLFLITFLAYKQLKAKEPSLAVVSGMARLEEYRERAIALLGQAPVAATVPALIYLIANYGGQSNQIPQLLLFISYGGAVVFLLGNTYQFYGHTLIPRLLRVVESRQWRILLLTSGGVIGASLLLTLPIGVLLGWMKEGEIRSWPAEWYLSVGTFAAGTALAQWYSAIFVGLKKPAFIGLSNVAYLFAAVSLYATSHLAFYYVIAVAAFIRVATQAALFSSRLATIK